MKIKKLKAELAELKAVDLHSAREHIKDLRKIIHDKDILLGAIHTHASMDGDQECKLSLEQIRKLTQDAPEVKPSRKNPENNHLF